MRQPTRTILCVALSLTPSLSRAQQAPPITLPPPGEAPPGPTEPRKETAWYERLNVRGYTQVRYNRLGNEISSQIGDNDDFATPTQDRSVGKHGGFLIRRARLILFGDVGEHVYVYLQPDFAGASAGNTQNIAAIRDFYGDLALDKQRTLRFRIGQSKVPFGWENMQSSQNRLLLDRSEAINSGAPGERDLGVFFYYASVEARRRFKHLVDSGLKGSGDYGVLALGVYNGQGVNEKEANDNRHVIARLTYPMKFGQQFVEASIGGYTGKFRPRVADADKQRVSLEALDIRDERAHATLVVYPQPLGFQAEFTVGRGPQLEGNPKDEQAGAVIRRKNLLGGYAQVMLKLGSFMPVVRAQYYKGARKNEENAPPVEVREVEAGLEWQPIKQFELTGSYLVARRTANTAPYDLMDGRVLRFQLQFNY